MLAPQHAVSLCKSVGSPARWAANEKVLSSLHAGHTVSFYYWDLIFCVRYSVAASSPYTTQLCTLTSSHVLGDDQHGLLPVWGRVRGPLPELHAAEGRRVLILEHDRVKHIVEPERETVEVPLFRTLRGFHLSPRPKSVLRSTCTKRSLLLL